LFSDLGKICVPTLIFHGIHYKVCPFQLAVAQKEEIKNSKLVPFKTAVTDCSMNSGINLTKNL
jgi:non-heme chloroperoxidase